MTTLSMSSECSRRNSSKSSEDWNSEWCGCSSICGGPCGLTLRLTAETSWKTTTFSPYNLDHILILPADRGISMKKTGKQTARVKISQTSAGPPSLTISDLSRFRFAGHSPSVPVCREREAGQVLYC